MKKLLLLFVLLGACSKQPHDYSKDACFLPKEEYAKPVLTCTGK